MGGLDSRYCVEELDGDEYVDDLVTLGTPHQGTYVAYLAYVTPGGHDMVPGSDFLTDLNDGHLDPGVSYTALYSSLDEAISPDKYAALPEPERSSVPDARNVHTGYQFHLQLAWDGDVVAQYVDRLD